MFFEYHIDVLIQPASPYAAPVKAGLSVYAANETDAMVVANAMIAGRGVVTAAQLSPAALAAKEAIHVL